MLLKSIPAILCTLALATATPALLLTHHHNFTNSLPPPRKVLTAREASNERGKIGGMYMCTGINFTGNCTYMQPPMESCYAIPPPFRSNIASFGPDEGFGGAIPVLRFGCWLYEDDVCSVGNVRFEYPGVSNGELWVVPRSVKCEFYDPAGMELYKKLRMDY